MGHSIQHRIFSIFKKKEKKPDSGGSEVVPGGHSAIDPFFDQFWPLDGFQFEKIQALSFTQIRQQFTGDPWIDNLILNKYEFAQGISALNSFPWRISIPFTKCNAHCKFCNTWTYNRNQMKFETVQLLIPVLRYCYNIDLVGVGEPLIHPRFRDILALLKENTDPRSKMTLTTNGSHLGRWVDDLLEANIHEYSVSLHAATARTHHELMDLKEDTFEKTIDAIRYLVEKKEEYPDISVTLVFILTRQNIEELPDFISLSNEIGVDKVFIRTLAPKTKLPERLNYHTLPPYLHPDFEKLSRDAVSAIGRSNVPVTAFPDTWKNPVFPDDIEKNIRDIPVVSEEKIKADAKNVTFTDDTSVLGEPLANTETPGGVGIAHNPNNRHPPYHCLAPYTSFYIDENHYVYPCCYMGIVPGFRRINYREGVDFFRMWNCPALVELRRRLKSGPLFSSCLTCPFYY